jgi:hypothetical protein
VPQLLGCLELLDALLVASCKPLIEDCVVAVRLVAPLLEPADLLLLNTAAVSVKHR